MISLSIPSLLCTMVVGAIPCISLSQDFVYEESFKGKPNNDLLFTNQQWKEFPQLEKLRVQCIRSIPGSDSIYVGTRSGLFVYNGVEVKSVLPETFENDVTQILVSSGKKLYFLSSDGFYSFSKNEGVKEILKNTFSDFDPMRSPFNRTPNIIEDSLKNIWFILNSELYKFNTDTETTTKVLTRVRAIQRGKNSVWIQSINSNELIQVTKEDLQNPDIESCQSIPLPSSKENSHRKRRQISFCTGESGQVYTLSNNSKLRLHQLDFETLKWKEIYSSKQVKGFSPIEITLDSENRVWFMVDRTVFSIHNGIVSEYQSDQLLSPRFGSSLELSNSDYLWIYNKKSSVFRITLQPTNVTRFEDLIFQCYDEYNNPYFIDQEGGLFSYKNDEIERINKQFHDDFVASFVFQSPGKKIVVVGMTEEEISLVEIDEENIVTQNFPYDKSVRISADHCVDEEGNIYVVARKISVQTPMRNKKMVLILDRENSDITEVSLDNTKHSMNLRDLKSGPNNNVYFLGRKLYRIKENKAVPEIKNQWFSKEYIRSYDFDETGNLWVSEGGSGISKRKPDGSWVHYSEIHDEMLNVQISSILCGNLDDVWCLTNRGLVNFDGHNWQTYDLSLSQEIYTLNGTIGSVAQNEIFLNFGKRTNNLAMPDIENRMKSDFFGFSKNTINLELNNNPFFFSRLNSLSIKFDKEAPETFIQNLDESIPSGGNIQLRWSAHDNWNRTSPSDLLYSFRINGSQWSPFSPRKGQYLSNLKSGNYKVEVRSRDKDLNIDETPAVARFEVDAPFWMKWPFLLSLLIAAATIVTLIVLLIRQKVRQAQVIEQHRIDLFTQASHELRTPLSIVLIPLRRMLEKIDGDLRSDLETSLKGAEQLEKLIDQILEFRKLESTNSVEEAPFELDAFASECTFLYREYGKEKEIDFEVDLPSDITISSDIDKLRCIIDNLLSNAFKYTSKGGKISLKFGLMSEGSQLNDSILKIQISDNGRGIFPVDLKKIFNPFERGTNTHKSTTESGSGIGLGLVKKNVELLGGSISVKSELKNGSNFKVLLPVKIPSVNMHGVHSFGVDPNTPQQGREDVTLSIVNNGRKPRVLLAEDNHDLRHILSNQLSSFFDITTAENGEEALNYIRTEPIDAVISDIMMEPINGYELCTQLKTNLETSHLPVILLTALKPENYVIGAWKVGADAYIKKPCHINSLVYRVKNLLNARNQLRENYLAQNQITPTAITNNELDKRFVQRALKVIEEHLDDYEFNVESFAQCMNMSRTSLYQKIKSITGESPSHLYRKYRMNKAVEFITQEGMSASEVAPRVGYLDLSHFGSCFKKEFGCPPSKYREMQLSKETNRKLVS